MWLTMESCKFYFLSCRGCLSIVACQLCGDTYRTPSHQIIQMAFSIIIFAYCDMQIWFVVPRLKCHCQCSAYAHSPRVAIKLKLRDVKFAHIAIWHHPRNAQKQVACLTFYRTMRVCYRHVSVCPSVRLSARPSLFFRFCSVR